MPCPASRPIPSTTSRGRRTGCCPSRHATSVDGPQGGCGGRPASQRHWRPGPSPHSARTTVAAAEAPPHPWTGCGDTRVRGSSGERPKDPLPPNWPPASLAERHHHGVVLDTPEQSPLLQSRQHRLPGLKPGEALSRRRAPSRPRRGTPSALNPAATPPAVSPGKAGAR